MEFTEIMKQFRRMMEAKKNGGHIPVQANYTVAYNSPEKFEKIVMEWAEKNPEPVYPTWCEWLVTQGVMGGTKETGHFVKDELFNPIPAETAQKLGIEPKEG